MVTPLFAATPLMIIDYYLRYTLPLIVTADDIISLAMICLSADGCRQLAAFSPPDAFFDAADYITPHTIFFFHYADIISFRVAHLLFS